MKLLEKTYLEQHGNELISERGITKTLFAEKMGVAAQNVNKMLATKDIFTISKAAEVLDIELDYLLYGPQNETSVSGYLEYQGKVSKIGSVEDIRTFLRDIEQTGETE